MQILRSVVFPIIWMILVLIIAIALIKMAFFSGTETAETEFPSMNMLASTTIVGRGDIASSMELSGTVERDPGVPVLAVQSGEVNHIWVNDGDAVLRGTRLFQIKVPEEQMVETPVTSVGEDGEEVTEMQVSSGTTFKYYDVVSPADGTLSNFTLKIGSGVEKEGVVGEITAGTFSINADLSPEQQFQLLDLELKATANVAGLKEPITCVGTKVGEKKESETQQPAAPPIDVYDPYGTAAAGNTPSLARLSCPMPPGTKTVPGLTGTVTIDTGSVSDVLVVPTTAVIGQITHGTVYSQDPATGEQQEIEVELGLQGEGMVEIKSGLEEGQEILEFAPGVNGMDPYGFEPIPGEVVY